MADAQSPTPSMEERAEALRSSALDVIAAELVDARPEQRAWLGGHIAAQIWQTPTLLSEAAFVLLEGDVDEVRRWLDRRVESWQQAGLLIVLIVQVLYG